MPSQVGGSGKYKEGYQWYSDIRGHNSFTIGYFAAMCIIWYQKGFLIGKQQLDMEPPLKVQMGDMAIVVY